MIAIVAVDNRYGMLFNHRRLSSDRVLNARIVQLTEGKPLWMNAYSARLFKDTAARIRVDEDFLSRAERGDFCFVETLPLLPHRNRLEALIVCRFNRDYPSDFRLDLTPEDHGMSRVWTEEFAGSSHETITMEQWRDLL